MNFLAKQMGQTFKSALFQLDRYHRFIQLNLFSRAVVERTLYEAGAMAMYKEAFDLLLYRTPRTEPSTEAERLTWGVELEKDVATVALKEKAIAAQMLRDALVLNGFAQASRVYDGRMSFIDVQYQRAEKERLLWTKVTEQQRMAYNPTLGFEPLFDKLKPLAPKKARVASYLGSVAYSDKHNPLWKVKYNFYSQWDLEAPLYIIIDGTPSPLNGIGEEFMKKVFFMSKDAFEFVELYWQFTDAQKDYIQATL